MAISNQLFWIDEMAKSWVESRQELTLQILNVHEPQDGAHMRL
jgi:hypothetical protein